MVLDTRDVCDEQGQSAGAKLAEEWPSAPHSATNGAASRKARFLTLIVKKSILRSTSMPCGKIPYARPKGTQVSPLALPAEPQAPTHPPSHTLLKSRTRRPPNMNLTIKQGDGDESSGELQRDLGGDLRWS